MSLRTRACTSCASPATLAVDACPYCGAHVGWPIEPRIDRGASIADVHCPRSPLPGEKNHRAGDERGARVDLETDRWSWGEIGPKLADGCIAVTGTTLDVGGWLGVIVRARHYGETHAGYVVDVHPGTRSLRVTKQVWGKIAVLDPIARWRTSSVIRPPGEANEIEARFAGPSIQVFVNAVHALTVTDDAFGYGHAMWHADSSKTGPASVAIARVELFHVR